MFIDTTSATFSAAPDSAPEREAGELPMTWADAFPWLGSGALFKDEPIDVANTERLRDVARFIAGSHDAKRLADCFPFISPEFELSGLVLPNTVARYWAGRNYSVFSDVATLRVRSVGDIPQVGSVMKARALAALAAENVRSALLQAHVGDEIARATGTDVTGCTFAEPFVPAVPGAGAATTAATTDTVAAPAATPAAAPAAGDAKTERDTEGAARYVRVSAATGAAAGAAAVDVDATVAAAPSQPAATVPAQVAGDVAAVTQWLVNVGKAALPIDAPGLFDGISGPAAGALARLRATPLFAWTNQVDYTGRFSRRVADHVARLRGDQRVIARRAVSDAGDGGTDTAQLSGWVRGILAEFISSDNELTDFIVAVTNAAEDTPLADLIAAFPVLTDVVYDLDAPLWRVVAWLSGEFTDTGSGFVVRDGNCVATD